MPSTFFLSIFASFSLVAAVAPRPKQLTSAFNVLKPAHAFNKGPKETTVFDVLKVYFLRRMSPDAGYTVTRADGAADSGGQVRSRISISIRVCLSLHYPHFFHFPQVKSKYLKVLTFLSRYILPLDAVASDVAVLKVAEPEDVDSMAHSTWDDNCNKAARKIQDEADSYLKKRRKAQKTKMHHDACSAAAAANLPPPKPPASSAKNPAKPGGRPEKTTITAMDSRLSNLGGIDMAAGKGRKVPKVDGDWIKKTDAEVDAILGMDEGGVTGDDYEED